MCPRRHRHNDPGALAHRPASINDVWHIPLAFGGLRANERFGGSSEDLRRVEQVEKHRADHVFANGATPWMRRSQPSSTRSERRRFRSGRTPRKTSARGWVCRIAGLAFSQTHPRRARQCDLVHSVSNLKLTGARFETTVQVRWPRKSALPTSRPPPSEHLAGESRTHRTADKSRRRAQCSALDTRPRHR